MCAQTVKKSMKLKKTTGAGSDTKEYSVCIIVPKSHSAKEHKSYI